MLLKYTMQLFSNQLRNQLNAELSGWWFLIGLRQRLLLAKQVEPASRFIRYINYAEKKRLVDTNLIIFHDSFRFKQSTQTGKTTVIRLIAVQETGVSRHHGEPIEGSLKPLVHHSTIVLRNLRGSLNRAPIMQRDASLSVSQC